MGFHGSLRGAVSFGSVPFKESLKRLACFDIYLFLRAVLGVTYFVFDNKHCDRVRFGSECFKLRLCAFYVDECMIYCVGNLVNTFLLTGYRIKEKKKERLTTATFFI